MKQPTSVKVFVTKTRRFRAKISESGCAPYEVTIGGQSWNEGKGREYFHRIKASIIVTLIALQQEARRLDNDVLE